MPGRLTGEVIYADHFGNLVTNIDSNRLPRAVQVNVDIRGRRILGLSRTFHDSMASTPDGLIALTGSHGFLEVAFRDGSAAQFLQAGAGEAVTVTLTAH